MTADNLIASARACIGTRFQHQGRIPGMALDCAGLIIFVAADNGEEYRDVQGYSRTPSHQQLKGALDDQPCLIPVDVRQPGDVLLCDSPGIRSTWRCLPDRRSFTATKGPGRSANTTSMQHGLRG